MDILSCPICGSTDIWYEPGDNSVGIWEGLVCGWCENTDLNDWGVNDYLDEVNEGSREMQQI